VGGCHVARARLFRRSELCVALSVVTERTLRLNNFFYFFHFFLWCWRDRITFRSPNLHMEKFVRSQVLRQLRQPESTTSPPCYGCKDDDDDSSNQKDDDLYANDDNM
jgi:hypothetical protein